jgi:5-formyltetrahydrofolate cyclo-ligase
MDTASQPTRRKAEVRRALAEARRRLPESERRDRSLKIADACRNIAGFSTAEVICTYVNFREEVETTELIAGLLHAGRRVAVPVHLHGTTPSLNFAEIDSLDELSPNHFGILQPRREEARFLPTAAIPLFLVPGLAFDSAGRRLGYGLGFYDRAFAAAAPGAIKIGLAFELQLIERVPADAHDVLMDFVVTEERVLTAAAGGAPTMRR